jgi:ankyrin repeat protein
MMSVFLTEELERYTAHIHNATLAYFFCSAADEKRNTAVAVLRGLVHQIITERPQLVKHALPYFETQEKIQQTLSSLEALWIIFSKLVTDADLGTIVYVLDGLDECEESTLRVLLPRLIGLLAGGALSSSKGRFKLAIISRDIPGLQGCTRIRLDPDNDEKIASDIELFVSARVQKLSRIEGFNNNFQSSVQKALLKRAEGTFLWLGFAINELSQKQTCSEIWEALEDLPSGLPGIYSRMLLSIPAKRRSVSQAILRWVTMAARPLQLQELAAATEVRPSSTQVTIEQAIRNAIALCGPLLKVQEQEVSLIHQSARDYLQRKERDSDTVLEGFRLIAESSHLELAQKCVDCVAQSDLQHRVINLDAKPGPKESPLLRYATLHWPEHAKSCSALAAKLFDSSGLFLQKESCLRDNWWKTYNEMKEEYQRVRSPLLHIACILEIVPWVEAVLAKKSWRPRYYRRVNQKNYNGETALHWAAIKGNKVLVRLLVDKGADVKAEDNNRKTVLHLAAQGADEVLVRLLVDKGADIKAKDDNGQTVLHEAVKGGNEAVVRLLVDRGADVKAKDNHGQMVLHEAVKGGNEAVVRLLVDEGVDIEAKGNDGKTVLHEAARRGNEAVVRLLIDKEANIEAEDKWGKTVLHEAAWRGSEAVLRLLVDKGADVEAKDNDGRTVLHQAASFWTGNEASVRLLVDKGASVEVEDNYGKTVLHEAAWRGNEAVVRLLVDKGADVKAKDNRGRTVLHQAALSWRKNEALVRLLVERGADINAEDNDGKTALLLAARGETVLRQAASGGIEAVVRLLVDRGADVKAKDNHRQTVLHEAVKGGNEAVVRLLVDEGVDIKAKGNDGKTVLHEAAQRGNEAVVRLLVDKGANVEAKDKSGKTVLHEAVKGGNEAVVRLLVDKGADVKAKDDNGQTVLHWAALAWRKNEAVVQLLVDKGANIEAKNKSGKTVLHEAAWSKNRVAVRLLVDRGADIMAKDNDGRTVLFWAGTGGDVVVVRLLIDKGADVKGEYWRFAR